MSQTYKFGVSPNLVKLSDWRGGGGWKGLADNPELRVLTSHVNVCRWQYRHVFRDVSLSYPLPWKSDVKPVKDFGSCFGVFFFIGFKKYIIIS